MKTKFRDFELEAQGLEDSGDRIQASNAADKFKQLVKLLVSTSLSAFDRILVF